MLSLAAPHPPSPAAVGLKRNDLASANKGRLRLRQSLSGTMKNPQDLQAFPFDIDDVAMKLRTGIHSRLADGTMESVCNSGRLYCARKINDPNGPNYPDEGDWLYVCPLWHPSTFHMLPWPLS